LGEEGHVIILFVPERIVWQFDENGRFILRREMGQPLKLIKMEVKP